MKESPTFEHPSLYGYRLDQVAHAFDRVRNHHDWKAPIHTTINVADQMVVEIAIHWFTGTTAEFTPVPGSPGLLLVTAPGQRLGPAGQPDELPRRLAQVAMSSSRQRLA